MSSRFTCSGTTKTGRSCTRRVRSLGDYCHLHASQRTTLQEAIYPTTVSPETVLPSETMISQPETVISPLSKTVIPLSKRFEPTRPRDESLKTPVTELIVGFVYKTHVRDDLHLFSEPEFRDAALAIVQKDWRALAYFEPQLVTQDMVDAAVAQSSWALCNLPPWFFSADPWQRY